MVKQIGWLVLIVAVIGGLYWWFNIYPKGSDDNNMSKSENSTQESQPATASEKAVSADLKASDQDANSIDFSSDFSSGDLDGLAN